MEDLNSLEDFLAKIDWEGGVTGALDYGLNVDGYDVPPEIADKWEELQEYYSDFENVEAEFWAAVKDAGITDY